jgi:hypothetical protein
MIDPTPMYLYQTGAEFSELVEQLMHCEAYYTLTPSRRARRLAILISEAAEAGHYVVVRDWLCDVGRFLLKLDPGCDPTGILRTTLAVLHESPNAELPDVDPPSNPAPGQFMRMHIYWWSDGILRGREHSAVLAWENAQHAIAMISDAAAGYMCSDEAVTEAEEKAIEECARLAYARLFPKATEARS